MTAADLTLVAKAEKILNRTLAYQAAIAVHDLKDRLDLNVAELRLVVAPESAERQPAATCVTCTIAKLATPRAANSMKVIVKAEHAIVPVESGQVTGRKDAKPATPGRARRSASSGSRGGRESTKR